MPANWNSYSKSETALNPRKIIFDLYLLHKDVVKDLKDITLTLFLFSLISVKSAFLTISDLSLISNR